MKNGVVRPRSVIEKELAAKEATLTKAKAALRLSFTHAATPEESALPPAPRDQAAWGQLVSVKKEDYFKSPNTTHVSSPHVAWWSSWQALRSRGLDDDATRASLLGMGLTTAERVACASEAFMRQANNNLNLQSVMTVPSQ